MAQSPSEKSAVGDSNQRMPKNLPPSIKDAHFLLQVTATSLPPPNYSNIEHLFIL
jgi:hypothetical protein